MMKLIRFGQVGREAAGVVDHNGDRRDVSSLVADYDADFFESGSIDLLRGCNMEDLPRVPDEVRWAAPIARPGKIICVGLNYRDHADEANMPIPSEPLIFFKAPNTVVGPYDTILLPRGSEKTDWEIELGVVIGRKASYLASPDEAATRIAGYCISHDVSERSFQLERGGQWVKGKSCDTFNPLGPWLMTPDELPDIGHLSMILWVNCDKRQNGNTSSMIFDVNFIIYYLSQFMTLEPGDLINTGTPRGVGLGMKPPRFLQEGDVVELAIDQLGRQKSVCRRSVPG